MGASWLYDGKRGALSGYVGRGVLMMIILAVASALGYIFRYAGFPDANTVVVYLLAVLLIAWLTQAYAYGLVASVFATFAYNYFFAEPYFAFTVDDPSYITTFVTMTITALITSALTLHAKQSARIARQKESETKAVYNLTNQLTDVKDIHDIARVTVSVLSECFGFQAACLCIDEDGTPDDAFCEWPVCCHGTRLGVIRIPKAQARGMTETQTRLLRAMTESIALAMDRIRALEQRIRSREEANNERCRTNLLRAISHDLRTPLSGIIGASEMLLGMTDETDSRHGLITGIHTDADWLHAMVENILQLTRLQDGKLVLQKQPEAVEEIIGGAINHILKRWPDREIGVDVPEALLLVPMDAKLIEQVLINLLDNAVKHTHATQDIRISVDEDGDMVRFCVTDSGTGIQKDDLARIFQSFYTTGGKRAGQTQGIGLGLAICDAIVRAHGGVIAARNRTDATGAELSFTLPIKA